MTALSANRITDSMPGDVIAYDVAASTTIYSGSLVMQTAGYAIPGTDAASSSFLGVAQEKVDNSTGSAGDKTVDVRRKGIFKFAASGMAVTDTGALVHIVDDQTVGLAATTTNDVIVGRIAKFVSATEVWVELALV